MLGGNVKREAARLEGFAVRPLGSVVGAESLDCRAWNCRAFVCSLIARAQNLGRPNRASLIALRLHVRNELFSLSFGVTCGASSNECVIDLVARVRHNCPK